MKNKILAGLGVLVGLIILGGVFGGLKPQVAGTQIEATPLPTITATSSPTVTLTPSATPTPTPTPKPTVKPIIKTPAPTTQTQVVPPVIDAGCGTYINSAGNEVARPCPANNIPVGATARCGDGTYSYSQSRSGTCSHHGGVAQWL